MLNLNFNSNGSTPKYRQIIDTVQQLIKDGALQKGDKLPSCNELRKQYGLSQDTVYLAYSELKSLGLISSQVGIGYFVQNIDFNNKHKVFVLFDNLSAYKEDLYDAFKLTIKGNGSEQIFFHHNNSSVFESLIKNAIGEFTDFIIMPTEDKSAEDVLALLPENKVYLLDKASPVLKKLYAYVCQNFERDIYTVFEQNNDLINKYTRIILSIPNNKGHFNEIIKGFRAICKKYSKPCDLVFQMSDFEIQKGDAFIVVSDKDLVKIVTKSQTLNLELGSDIGIISYNETALKQIAAGGITTISTDFRAMGRSMAEMIVDGKKDKIHNPFGINKRKSI